ncbi:MAG: hypothetical protein L0H59_01270, partial [Tomitella sp.]|nr:hypothetical protein [Tomitella sp.]
MCKGKNEPGGPYRCSGHARAARDAAQAKVNAATSEWEHADAALTNAGETYQAALEEAGITDPVAALLGEHDGPGVDEAQRKRLDDLAAASEAASARYAAADKDRTAAQELLTQREDEYRATPDGAAEAARDLERATAVGSTPMIVDKAKHQQYVAQQMRKLQAAEQQMANEGAERAARWDNGNSKPPVRAAFPGGQHVVGNSG